ncbi:hypothetical protein K501DRAFT_322833 [Backusella circina FSU 941]|nr:hypothetical protein K501DRAFT_322833 [Backusella circina FSU 941]
MMSLDTVSLSSQSTSEAKQQSKLILRSALQKANEAVQCDSTNNVMGAVTAYNEAISLLDCVLATVEKENDRRRLQEIHDSYSERIRLLSTIAFKLDSNTPEDDPTSWLSKPTIPEHNNNDSRPYSKQQQEEDNMRYITTPTSAVSSSSSSSNSSNSNNNNDNNHITSTTADDMGSTKIEYSTVRSRWQDNISPPSSIRSVSLVTNIQKELPSPLALASPPPTSPIPLTPLQSSKSTPIKSPIQKKKSMDAFDIDKDELSILGQHESHHIETTPRPHHHHPPPRFSSRKPSASQLPPAIVDLAFQSLAIAPENAGSSRSSVSSFASNTSSVESSSSDLEVHQPAMALPSLKPKQSETPVIKNIFRARTSSLPRAPLMRRSSSMTTVETTTSLEEHRRTIADATSDFDDTSSTVSTAPSTVTSFSIMRPPIPRPGGLGSMRKKAANRLSRSSMDSGGSIRKDKAVFGLFIKEAASQKHEISSMDYIENRQSIEDEQVTLDSKHLKLIFALEKSMNEGGHITQNLYIPKNLWFQPNIRLNSMDIKTTACESLMSYINRLESWTYLNDLHSSLRLIESFELALKSLETNLSKKLKRDSLNSEETHHHRDSYPMRMDSNGSKKTQSFMSWGNKITKSVERMNAFSLTKTEDQFKHYIETLQRLFIKIHVLEYWLNHYIQKQQKAEQEQYDLMITKLVKVCDMINNVIGGFVITDITVLLAKWLKRGGSWVNE